MYRHVKETTTSTTTAVPSGLKTVTVREYHETECETDGELEALQHLADTVSSVTDKLKELDGQQKPNNPKPEEVLVNEAATPSIRTPAEGTPAFRIKQALAAVPEGQSHVILMASDVRAMQEYIEGRGI